ncbi:SDR family oxidoreductase [Granulicella sp. L46]|uniref:SDR family oxidoreductase n=1 Tax=Granulicella sp. L46 TaxID=1641865 RepID=UPI00131BC22C|nr:SDR family NAD(P)-dependent oxidoreductase [Granulicella sp. L46]
MKLEGNTIFITGGGSGIGRALAEALHQHGNKVIISGRRKSHLAKTVAANPGMESIELDVSDPASIHRVAKELIAKHPTLNVLINNAGIMQIDDSSTAIDDELITSTIATNLVGPVRLTGALIEHLKRQDSATVLFVSSVLGFTPMAMTAVYSSTKAAIHSYAQSIRFKLRHSSVSVLEIIPPWVRTELLNSSEEPRAMPLDEFLEGTMDALATDANEIMVPRARFLREQSGPREAVFVTSFNEQLEAPQT